MSGPLNVIKEAAPWYQEGLQFSCTECGKCCTGFPGYVWVTIDEMLAISKELNLTLDEFTKRYVRKIDDDYSLTEHPVSFDCVFLKDKKCQIYNVRPKQCRTFPWWAKNLSSKDAWEDAAKFCEGINHKNAPLVSCESIVSSINSSQ